MFIPRNLFRSEVIDNTHRELHDREISTSLFHSEES